MKKFAQIALISLLFVLVGCTASVCNDPYTEFKKGECCLDKNSDKICDSDQQEQIAKEDQIAKLDSAKEAMEAGSEVGISNITSKTCKVEVCPAEKVTPDGKRVQEDCTMQDVAVRCFTSSDCRQWMEESGAFEDSSEGNVECS